MNMGETLSENFDRNGRELDAGKVKEKSDNFLIVFLTRVIKHWNSLILDAFHGPSVRIFKIRLNLFLKCMI